ncbi:MAG: polysaccharide deacetylase family protein [Sphaerobacter sp.]|nr:polysaccharide deacetylase family protein [Sphaerobacter sp.]
MAPRARWLLLALPLALAAAHASPTLTWRWPGRYLFPAVRHVPGVRAVGLTFDDGPDPAALDPLLRQLADLGARATFFVTGEQVEAWPAGVRAILAAGHEVGLHGYRHDRHRRLPPWAAIADLRRGRAIVEDATGRPVELFRPPYGTFSLATWLEVRRQGWTPVLWNRDGRDWAPDATPATILASLGTLQPGDILLLHDSDRYGTPGSWRTTLAALPRLAERAAAAGLPLRSVGELLRWEGR